MSGSPATRFYTVADNDFFPGLVAMINSLRLSGSTHPVVVLDTGLSPSQRRVLETHVTVCDPPGDGIGNPLLFKPFPHLQAGDEIVVVIDADMIVTAPLEDILEAAAQGQICLLTDETQDPRWFAEWHDAFGLRRPLRHGPSRNSGFVAFATTHWPELLGRWWHACAEIPAASTRAHGAPWEHPFWDGDQDALNALLLSEVPDGAVSTWTQHVTDLLNEVEVLRPTTLTCTYRGTPTRVLHHTGGPKPWSRNAWMRVHHNAYVDLLSRLLFAADVEIRLHPRTVPLWLRPSRSGRTALDALTLVNRSARWVVSRLSGPRLEGAMRLRSALAGSPRR